MKPVAALAVLWILHASANLWWLSADTRPPTYDAAGHSITALQVADHLAGGQFRAAGRFLLTRDYPPLLYLASTPLAWWVDRSADALTAVNLLFLAVLLLSTYGLAREVSSPSAGLQAAAIVSAYPYVYGLSRQFLIDFALTALVALALWLMVRARGMDDPRASLAFGVALGLGLMAKTTFVQFVVAPALLVGVRAIRRRRPPQALRHLLLVGVPPLLIAGFWYWRNLTAQWRFVRFQALAGAREGDPDVASLGSWLHFLRAMAEVQLLLPFLAAFLVGLAATLAARRYRTDDRVFMVVAAVAVPYVLLSLQPNKDPRYSMPCLPAMAVITAWGLSTIRWRPVRLAALALLGGWAALLFAGLTFGLGGVTRAFRAGALNLVLYTEQAHTITPARREDWMSAAIVRDVARRLPAAAPGPTRLVVIPDAPFFEPNVFAYQLLSGRVDGVEVDRVTGLSRVGDPRARLLSAAFVIAKTGDQGPAWTVHDAEGLARELDDPRAALGQAFRRVGEYPLPDGSRGLLYEAYKP